MSTVGTGLTLGEWGRRLDPKGNVDGIIEISKEVNEILDDMIFVEGNLPTGHRTTVRSGYPTPTWRLLNYGVQPTKSRTVQVTDACGMLEAYAEVDKALADLNGNTAAFRLSEDKAHVIGMNEAFADKLFYGNQATDPEQITGLAPRFNDSTAENGGQILKAGGADSGGSTSIWLVRWGSDTVHGIFPKGSKAGWHHEDKGQITLEDAAGGLYEGYRSHYKWDVGMTVRNWKHVVRICNIDVSALTKDASAGADLIDLMIQASETIDPGSGKMAWYCNKTIRSFLRRQMINHDNVNLSMGEVAGKKVVMFDEIPVRRCDAILNTEATVS